MKLFETDSIEFMLWLSRAEWQLLHGLTFAWAVNGLLTDDWPLGRSYRFAIAELQRQHGYRFEGLEIDSNDDLWAKTEEPICPQLMLTINLMRRGAAPDYETHLIAAIAYATERIPGLDVEPMRQTLDKIQGIARQVETAVADVPKEAKERMLEALRERAAFFGRTKPPSEN